MAASGDAHEQLDCRGLDCPEPVWRARRRVDAMRPGQTLIVIATDPLAELDLAVLCQQTGHEYLGSEQDGDEWRIGIRVRTAPRRDAD